MADRTMNVSSLVVRTDPSRVTEVIGSLNDSGLCEVYFHDASGKIVVTIEGKNIGEEMEKMKKIQALPHVLSADLAYSYCESELNEAREQFIGRSDAVPEKLKERS